MPLKCSEFNGDTKWVTQKKRSEGHILYSYTDLKTDIHLWGDTKFLMGVTPSSYWGGRGGDTKTTVA